MRNPDTPLTSSGVSSKRPVNHEGGRSLVPERKFSAIVIMEELGILILDRVDLIEVLLCRLHLIGHVSGNNDLGELCIESNLRSFRVDHQVDL